MDYEKEYKEALERAREYHKVDNDNTLKIYAKGTMEYLFPVLKESEDERIRKYLLKLADRCPEDSIDFMGEVKKEDVVAWLEKQGEQNPAWSEDDELYLEDAIHAAKELYYANCGGDELVDWLKSLKDRVQPQPQNEWSEEDERMHKASIRACQYMVENFENSTWDYEDAIEWLKSLKPQPQWKPSDEQLNALDEVYKTHGANNVCRRIIFNLLEQLKKL